MHKVHSYRVLPNIPEAALPLQEIAYNLQWSWDPEAVELFRRLDLTRWRELGHNPVLLLNTVGSERLAEVAADAGFLALMERVLERQRLHASEPSWFQRAHGSEGEAVHIAYFSAEFGLHECLPLYSGGLGVLSGDHLKSAAELGLPLVGVGLLYGQGYFRQYLNAEGWQQEAYPGNDFENMPVDRVLDEATGEQRYVELLIGDNRVRCQLWKVQVGRVPLYLLDTNRADNSPEAQAITAQLYGGDQQTRIAQEMVLGIGGYRALRALGYHPGVCHMNEGHSAFLAVERARQLMEEAGLDFSEARAATSGGNVFTTHTPVPAGFDIFPPELVRAYMGPYVSTLGIDMERFLSLGRPAGAPLDYGFNMAVLALRSSASANAVSALHGEVSRKMVAEMMPGLPADEVAVGHVTNGVHTRSWISFEMVRMLERYLGASWATMPEDHSVWQRVEQIPDEELWHVHSHQRHALVRFARARNRLQVERRGGSPREVAEANEVLNPELLTLGFARRFATYKRATLLLSDVERFKSIVNNTQRPVQVIFAGKAHPKDRHGKEFIRHIYHVARDPELRRRMVFIENYDIAVARNMVQGVDVWLNNPRRPQEASGTSGMKVVSNGGLNMSVLDGWWDEGYAPGLGWAIGNGEVYQDEAYQDEVESAALYDLLEHEVAPCFYDREKQSGLPRAWVEMMRQSMTRLAPFFNTNRMLQQYTEKYYLPAARRHARMREEHYARARDLRSWATRVYRHWPEVQVLGVQAEDKGTRRVGEALRVRAGVVLGSLRPEEVEVQVFYGPLDRSRRIQKGQTVTMAHRAQEGERHIFEGEVPTERSGLNGYTVRVIPSHPEVSSPQMLGLLRWE